VGPDARERLAAEASRYAQRPRSYARLFAEQDAGERDWPGVAASDADDVPGLLQPYRAALDTCVVRALPAGDELTDLVAVAVAAARGTSG
jgi:hypothetical protein